MKKFLTRMIFAALSAVLLFSMCGCRVVEDGSVIKYAYVDFEFYDSNDKLEDTKTVIIKLYMNYAPDTCARFIALAESDFYKGLCVNNVASSWFLAGGYKYGENDVPVQVVTSLGYLNGKAADSNTAEFKNNGWVGNKITSSNGAVFMYRNFDDAKNVSMYGTAANQFGVLTSSSSLFPVASYAYFGKIVDEDSLTVVSDILDLNNSGTLNEDDEYEYNYYYNGGLKEVYTRRAADFQSNKNIDAEDIETIQNTEAGYMDNETYNDFYDVAEKFITSNKNDYFFIMPQTKVLIGDIKIYKKEQ